MDGGGEVEVVITNTQIARNEQDGLKFIKAMYLKCQRYKVALPPIIVCSADQRGDTIKLYAFRFADLALINYVLIKDEELNKDDTKLIDMIEKALEKRRDLDGGDPVAKAVVVTG